MAIIEKKEHTLYKHYKNGLFEVLYWNEQVENLFEATVRVRLISLIHLNILVLSAMWVTKTFLAGRRYLQVESKAFLSLSTGRLNSQNAHIDTAASINCSETESGLLRPDSLVTKKYRLEPLI